ncbi:MAG: amidohydrolase [Promethearchaeota archaeon]
MVERKIYFNGPIITMDEEQPLVEAIGIQGEKIIAVGNFEDIKNEMGNDFKLIDLKDNTILPGFIDCHMHPITFMFLLLNLDLSSVKSLIELQDILREAAKKKDMGEFIFGLKLKEEEFDVPILPNRWELDKACPDNPVFIIRYDGHIGIANSKALELLGINSETIVPEGAEIRKDKEGKLTGVISENALDQLLPKIYKFLIPKSEVIQETAIKAFKMFAKNGITSIHGNLQFGKGGKGGDLGVIEIPIYKSIQDKILQNWYALISTDKPEKLMKLKKPPLDGGKEDSKFKIGSLKLFLDGTFGAKTACMYEPFSDAPDSCGFCVIDEDKIYEKMKVAHNNGFQIAIHAIGDRGNRICIDLYKKLLKEYPRENHRHRVEHASMLTKDVIKDMKNNGIIASCQPPFINSEYTWLEKRLGKERCKYTYPMKSIIDGGVVLASGSDCPVEDPNPILGLHALVNRNGFIPKECISMKEALKSYTINAAYAAFEEKIKGSIKVGKLADLIILDKNPLEISINEIRNIQVLETIIRGKTVYKRLHKSYY